MAVAMIGPKFYAWDRNGKPLSFGKLYTYEAKTNIPKATYQTEDQEVENTNPVILNGEGYANVYLEGSYKMVLKDSDDNEIWTSDPVTASQTTEWVNCFSSTYISQTSFKVAGNKTDIYLNGRALRIDSNAANYEYTQVESAVYAGGETTVVVTDSVITTGLEFVCTSVISVFPHSATYNRNAVGAHDDIYIRTVTQAEAVAEDAPIGTRYKLSDRHNTLWIVTSDTVNNTDVVPYNSNALTYNPDGEIIIDAMGSGAEAIKRAFEIGGKMRAIGEFNFEKIAHSDSEVYLDASGAKFITSTVDDNDIKLTNFKGWIKGGLIISQPETTGSFKTFSLEGCEDFNTYNLHVLGGKNVPLHMLDCKDSNFNYSITNGTGTNRPFGNQIVNSKNCTFLRCQAYKMEFPFALLGPAYKSGGVSSTKDVLDCLGMSALHCYAEDHTGHAFDINGAAGALIDSCTAKDYTGTLGNSSFQIKQSTNIPEEDPDETYANKVTNCTAVNCANGFGCQQGVDSQFLDNVVIGAKRYGFVANSTQRYVLDGLKVIDWGQDLVSFPPVGGATKCPVINILSGSDDGLIDNVTAYLKTLPDTGTNDLGIISNSGDRTSIGTVKVRKTVGGDFSYFYENTGDNPTISYGCRPSAIFYDDIAIDLTNQTRYPIEMSVRIPADSTGIFLFNENLPRGASIAKIIAYSNSTNSPTFNIGTRTDTTRFANAETNTQYLRNFITPTESTLGTSDVMQVEVTSAGSAGELLITAFGFDLL